MSLDTLWSPRTFVITQISANCSRCFDSRPLCLALGTKGKDSKASGLGSGCHM